MLTLRRTVDVVTVLAALGLIGGLAYYKLEEQRKQEQVQKLTEDVTRFEQMIKLRAATKDVELNGRGWPVTIDPAWFGGDAPRNPLLTGDRPWVEVARPEDALQRDPLVRVALDERYAGFWYNPYQGIIRARVPLEINDKLTLDLYNLVNATTLPSIYNEWFGPTTAQTPPAEPTTETAAVPTDSGAPVESDVPQVDPNSEEALDPTRAPTPEPAAETPPSPAPAAPPPAEPVKPTGPPGKPKR
ncbi:MAG: hypothetical protein ACKVU4_02540 [Phycisphaerales bacterium]